VTFGRNSPQRFSAADLLQRKCHREEHFELFRGVDGVGFAGGHQDALSAVEYVLFPVYGYASLSVKTLSGRSV
jgi:hypothetical protein